MENMEPLLVKHPQLRIIHLIRDPRGAVLSRSAFDSGRGIYSGNDSATVRKEAELFCRDVVEDIRVRKRLETRFPGKFYSMTYDDFAVDPLAHAEKIYRFLNLEMSKSTLAAIRRITKPNVRLNITSQMIAGMWKDRIVLSQNRDVKESCKELFRLVKRKWEF